MSAVCLHIQLIAYIFSTPITLYQNPILVTDKSGENGENGDKENVDKEAEKEEKDLENNVNQLEEAADNFSAPSTLAPPEEDKKLTRRGSAKRKKSLAVPEKTPSKRPSLRRKSKA